MGLARTLALSKLTNKSGSGENSLADAIIDGSITAITSNVKKIKASTFHGCSKLTTANFPLVTSLGGSAFDECENLIAADFPFITSIGSYTFNNCRKLMSADLPLVTSIGSYAFSGCSSLKAVLLRSETMCSLLDENAFNACYHIKGTTNSTYNPNGDKDGYIYVPRALVARYQNTSKWSTYATQFRALEDYTMDGTITGALDESKI